MSNKIKTQIHLIEAGTILYSARDYNGLIIEYQLGKRDNKFHELYLFIKILQSSGYNF